MKMFSFKISWDGRKNNLEELRIDIPRKSGLRFDLSGYFAYAMVIMERKRKCITDCKGVNRARRSRLCRYSAKNRPL